MKEKTFATAVASLPKPSASDLLAIVVGNEVLYRYPDNCPIDPEVLLGTRVAGK
jgi:hypothetical protein